MPVIKSSHSSDHTPRSRAAPPPPVISFTPRASINRFPFRRLIEVKNSPTSLDWQEPTDRCRGTSFAQHSATTVVDEMRCRPGDSIDVLPDDVLLDIFDFFVEEGRQSLSKVFVEEWQTLVHVCRRWRSVVFGSPHRLNLRLVCSAKTPARDMLDFFFFFFFFFCVRICIPQRVQLSTEAVACVKTHYGYEVYVKGGGQRELAMGSV